MARIRPLPTATAVGVLAATALLALAGWAAAGPATTPGAAPGGRGHARDADASGDSRDGHARNADVPAAATITPFLDHFSAQPPYYGCPTSFLLVGSITSSADLDATYVFDITVHLAEHFATIPKAVHLTAGVTQPVSLSFSTNRESITGLQGILTVTAAGVAPASYTLSQPIQTVCGAHLDSVDVTQASGCGDDAAIVATLDTVISPVTETIHFRFSGGEQFDRTLSFPTSGFKSLEVDHIVTGPETVTVTVPYDLPITKTLRCVRRP